jgi:biopolymer transport protein ExbD
VASHVFKRGPAKAEMNITPLIDVVFLLIVFFMLVNKIVSDETVPMFVPRLTDPVTRELADVHRVVVNVPSRSGRDELTTNTLLRDPQPAFVQVGASRRFDPADLAGITAAVDAARQAAVAEADADPRIEVVLRADDALFYDAVQPILDAIADAGIDTIHLTALLPDDAAPASTDPEGH